MFIAVSLFYSFKLVCRWRHVVEDDWLMMDLSYRGSEWVISYESVSTLLLIILYVCFSASPIMCSNQTRDSPAKQTIET